MPEPAITPRPKRPRPKGPKKATGRHLENAALHYLQRFASSTVNFRRVMLRRVERSALVHGTDRAEGAATIEDLIRRYSAAGLLDDATYAAAKALSLFRRGNSPRAIRAKLKSRGVEDAAVESALAALADEAAEPELAAACALARRRRLGPYRVEPRREEGREEGRAEERGKRREKDLAALARAGFGYGVARAVVDADSVEEIEARAREGCA